MSGNNREDHKKKIQYLEGYYYARLNYDRLTNRMDNTDPGVVARIQKAEAKLKEFRECVFAVDNDRLRMLLELRYFDNLSWEQVAEEMNYSYSRITKLHGKALDALEIPIRSSR